MATRIPAKGAAHAVVLPTREKKVEIRRRCVARPTDHQAILLDRLGLRLPRQLKVAGRM